MSMRSRLQKRVKLAIEGAAGFLVQRPERCVGVWQVVSASESHSVHPCENLTKRGHLARRRGLHDAIKELDRVDKPLPRRRAEYLGGGHLVASTPQGEEAPREVPAVDRRHVPWKKRL
jgi:hypothetical protein